MKRFRNKALAAAILLCMMFSLLATPIMAAENAATTTEYDYIYDVGDETVKDIVNSEGKPEETYPEEGYPNEQAQYITVTSEDMFIQKGEMGDCYYMDVYGYGAAASGFCMEIEIPYFIQVMEVRFSDRLNSAENAVSSTSKFGESVMIAYSSAENFENDLLFTLVFTMRHNLVEEEYGYLYAYGTQFVNADAELVDFNVELGKICVTANGDAPADIMMGDADLNGFVELADVMYILQTMVSYRDFTELSFMAADIDRNGTIDMMDCQYIQNYLVGRLESLDNINGDVYPPAEEECYHKNMYEEKRVEATCEKSGIIVYRCDDCGYTYREMLAPLEHAFYGEYCENCGISKEEYENGGVVTPPADGCNHEKKYERYSENATCCKEGIIDWYCEECGYEYKEILPVVSHEFYDGYCMYCNMSEEEYNGGHEGEISFLTSYKDEEFYFELYSDDTFVGTVCQYDINMDGKLDMSDVNEIRGNWMLSEDQSVLILNDKISGQTFTFKVTAEGEIYR